MASGPHSSGVGPKSVPLPAVRDRAQDELEGLRVELARLRVELAATQGELEARVRESEAKEVQLERYAADLREIFKQERARALELQRSYIVTVRALSNAVEARDAYTAKHAERVAAYGLTVARAMGVALADDPATEFGFLLHDVGKVAIPDGILHKPGPLTTEERAVMERHPVIGAEIIAEIPFLAGDAAAVIRSHHERWDGSGYPDRLAGDAIPLAARIFAVADVFDALTTSRPYRTASSFAEAREEIIAVSGRHFDPVVASAFGTIPDAVLAALASP
ncbi:HD-GYP domain-containing protein [Conexibacter sp. DBS9H8]|uniref:HD-GYP domain-containing protein n=1 Tax=Conexibacter sp. DBS9H8 TaxID=2937801 RepID=UPI0020104952|nr:HD domain-containing phosphohydrolase [Conexibacter sp. DBS9H8]